MIADCVPARRERIADCPQRTLKKPLFSAVFHNTGTIWRYRITPFAPVWRSFRARFALEKPRLHAFGARKHTRRHRTTHSRPETRTTWTEKKAEGGSRKAEV